MFSIGSLAFATPWVLAALAVLPVIWWLLRITPPSPRVIPFPAIRLLRNIDKREETPSHTPWWLLVLRMIIAALIIIGLSRPLLNPAENVPGSGPVLLVVDNGWASAPNWNKEKLILDQVIEQAGREGREVMIAQTAPPDSGDPIEVFGPVRAADARAYAETLAPQPWPTRHDEVLNALTRLPQMRQVHTVWLSDGLRNIAEANPTERMADKLQHLGGLTLFKGSENLPPLTLDAPETVEDALVVTARAPKGLDIKYPVSFQARAMDGRLLQQVDVKPGDDGNKGNTVTAKFDLPPEVHNELSRIRILGQPSAAATLLLDEKWKRRPVGLAASGGDNEDLPFLSQLYYLRRALAPFSELHSGTIPELLKKDLSVMILADIGSFTAQEYTDLSKWVEDGGVLVRFAGPTLAGNADQLVPVRLRRGGRTLDGTLTWSEPSKLAPFPETSPFYGLDVPDDVVVRRQVLAEPSTELPEKTWAALQDGTPLVTSEKRGKGRIVLVHTTANADWSNLAMSGLFVDMLQRIIQISSGVAEPGGKGVLQPIHVLNGRGRLVDPAPVVRPLSTDQIDSVTIDPHHPPGLYGSPAAQVALNLAGRIKQTEELRRMPINVDLRSYDLKAEQDLKPWLLSTALILLLADLLIMLWLRGLFRPRMATAAVMAAILAGSLAMTVPHSALAADAQDKADINMDKAIKLTGETWLAYVPSGDPAVDNVTRAGMEALARVIGRRTAAEPAGAVAVDLEHDELAFFPLIYWPLTPDTKALSEEAALNLQKYINNGGLILFDTRDQQLGQAFENGNMGVGLGTRALRRVTADLDIPPLEPISPDHVLTRAFYLLSDFPGRYTGGDLWVEQGNARRHDGVTTVIVGSNDWASAWASPHDGGATSLPGGERQREMAYRFGVNLVMVALTGNYKTDQVHIPHILERLGQ